MLTSGKIVETPRRSPRTRGCLRERGFGLQWPRVGQKWLGLGGLGFGGPFSEGFLAAAGSPLRAAPREQLQASGLNVTSWEGQMRSPGLLWVSNHLQSVVLVAASTPCRLHLVRDPCCSSARLQHMRQLLMFHAGAFSTRKEFACFLGVHANSSFPDFLQLDSCSF